jgi:uncharacterized membrane protein YccC
MAVPDWLTEVVPDWLADAVRPKKAPVPWPDMIRAVFAIWVPLAAGFITGRSQLVAIPALGALLSVMIDTGGPYRARVRKIGAAAVFGGAAGLAIGTLIHGRGWTAVIALVVVAGLSGIISRLGATGSSVGLQLLVYAAIGLGPIGALRPWWHTALQFVAGAVWGLLLITPGWLLSPRGAEQRAVGAVYHSFAKYLRAIGTPQVVPVRDEVTVALNAAYDALLTGRSHAGGRNRADMHLMTVLNVSHQMAEAATALRAEGQRPPPWVTDTIDRLAESIARGSGPTTLRAVWGRGAVHGAAGGAAPLIPPQWSQAAGALALRDSMVALARAISGNLAPPSSPPAPADWRSRLRDGTGYLLDQLVGGRVAWTFTIRLMVCTGVAAAITQTLTLQRSYWVVLTVAIILKPDYGSVFARAVQRGIGTVVGAVLGAAILAVVPYGPLLLIPFGVLAALLPFGKSKNFGLSATFLTPLVVLLIDLQNESGWRLAAERLVDTLLACAIVLLIGYAPWPSSWQAHLPVKFAAALRALAAYLDEALVTALAAETATGDAGSADAGGPAWRMRLRRRVGQSLSNLRVEYQRTMSEPTAVSRHAAAWWPAVVGLEEVMDAITATVVAISRGAPQPAPDSVHRLSGALRALADAMDAGVVLDTPGDLPDDPELQTVTAAVRSVLGVLTSGRRPAAQSGATAP